jgi:Ca2+-binding EF-hand superfamily protein
MMMFEYRKELGIPIEKLAESVTKIYYPFKDDHLHNSLKNDIVNALKEYGNEYKDITEEKFVEVMKSIETYSNEDYHFRFLERLFKRYDKNKDGFIDQFGTLIRIHYVYPKHFYRRFYHL